MGFELVQEAVERDPLAPGLQVAFEHVANGLRASLARAQLGDPSVPRMYDLLQAQGESDLGSHLAMVRWLVAARHLEQAEALAGALVLTTPASREAWVARADVAAARGRADEAALFRAEALLRGTGAAPWSLALWPAR